MPTIDDEKDLGPLEAEPAKILGIGDNGDGKTGSLAALVCIGYNIRSIDTDNGFKPLRSLLTDGRYPYASWIKKKGISLREVINFQPVSLTMGSRKEGNVNILAPSGDAGRAWDKIAGLLMKWEDKPLKLDLGHIQTWSPMDVLVLDSFSTMAKMAFYGVQAMNGRLGARETGYDYQRDIGEAQSQLTRLLEWLGGATVPCSVAIMTHIRRLDDSQGFAQSPEQRAREGRPVNAKGYPMAIGAALSPVMGKYFNDVFKYERVGTSTRRRIKTVPSENVNTKNSAYLEPEYTVETGLAEIFCALRHQPPPTEFLEHCAKFFEENTKKAPAKGTTAANIPSKGSLDSIL